MNIALRLVTLLGLIPAAGLPAQNWGQTHSSQDLLAFASAQAAGQKRISQRAVMRAASARGWLKTPAERRLIKRQLRHLVRQAGAGGRFLHLGGMEPGHNLSQSLLAVAETEYNDGPGWAQDLGVIIGSETVNGSLDSGEVDSFRLSVPVDGTLVVSATSSSTLPWLEIDSGRGDELWGMAFRSAGSVTLDVPAGEYVIRVAGGSTSGAFTYSAKIDFTLGPVPTLAFSGNRQTTLYGDGLRVFRAVLPADGRLDLDIVTGSNAGSYLWLLNENFGYMFDVDDDSLSSNGDAGLNALLPQGTYYIAIEPDSNSITPVATVTARFTAATIPTVNASTPGNGSIPGGEEDFDSYRITVAANQSVTLDLAGRNGANGIIDSFLTVYDSKMRFALESDEENNSNSSFSKITATLPPGTYYACSSGYYDYGDYALSMSTGAAAVSNAQAGSNPANLAAVDTAMTFRLTLGTATRLGFEALLNTLPDSQLWVISSSGESWTWNDDSFRSGSEAWTGAVLPAGEYWIVVKDWDGNTGSIDLQLLAPLSRFANDNVIATSHAGDLMYYCVSTKGLPAYNPLPGILEGNVLLDLSTAIILVAPMGATGQLDFQASLVPNSGPFLQHAAIQIARNKGIMSNLLN